MADGARYGAGGKRVQIMERQAVIPLHSPLRVCATFQGRRDLISAIKFRSPAIQLEDLSKNVAEVVTVTRMAILTSTLHLNAGEFVMLNSQTVHDLKCSKNRLAYRLHPTHHGNLQKSPELKGSRVSR